MFGTSGIRGRFGGTVTVELAVSVGQALVADGADRIVVGRDPRLTGPVLADGLAAGARAGGADVIDLGVAATPTIARSVGWQDADVGVAITASHNPPEDNGIKLWTASGMAFDDDRRARIVDLLERNASETAAWDAVGTRSAGEGDTRHAQAVADAVDPPEDGLRVVVDVGNGAGGVTVRALRELGCTVETLNERPDGRFPARPSEPTEENCETLAATVGATDADLGIAHDGDADRMRAVDETGTFLAGDVLVALFGRAAVAGEDSDRIAAPVNTSLAVDDALAAVGGSVTKARVGDVFIAERARQSDVAFGGEPSGAWIWPAETLAPDGTLAAAKLVALVGRKGPLSALRAEIDQYPLYRESHDAADKAGVMDAVTALIETERVLTYERVDRTDGIRIETDDGWLLVRPSGTEPVVRLTAEAREDRRARELLDAGRELLERAHETS